METKISVNPWLLILKGPNKEEQQSQAKPMLPIGSPPTTGAVDLTRTCYTSTGVVREVDNGPKATKMTK